MKHIKLFEGFDSSDNLNIRNLGNAIAKALFPGYEEGKYEENTRYGYGETVKFDGKDERGVTYNVYTLRLTGEWLVLESLDFDKKDKKAFLSIVDPKLHDPKNLVRGPERREGYKHKYTTLDHVTIRVTSVKGITSKKERMYDVTVWAGDRERGAYAYADLDFPDKVRKGATSWMELTTPLKKKLDESAKKNTLVDLVSTLFGNVGALDMVPSKDLKRDQVTKSWGIGSGASDNVFHTIHKAYDFSKFVKKYGIKVLQDALDTKAASYFKGKRFKGLSDDGFMTTDESWVDKYD